MVNNIITGEIKMIVAGMVLTQEQAIEIEYIMKIHLIGTRFRLIGRKAFIQDTLKKQMKQKDGS